MHPAIIIGIVCSLIVDVAMGQIPRSTERISSFQLKSSFVGILDDAATGWRGRVLYPDESHVASPLCLGHRFLIVFILFSLLPNSNDPIFAF